MVKSKLTNQFLITKSHYKNNKKVVLMVMTNNNNNNNNNIDKIKIIAK